MRAPSPKKRNGPGGLLSLFGQGKGSAAEKERLAAILNASPAAWCAWESGESVSYSPSFPACLGIDGVRDIASVQDALSPSDAAVLESLFARLKNDGTAFETTVQSLDGKKIFRLSGARSAALDILWLTDITSSRTEQNALHQSLDRMTDEHDRLQSTLDNIATPLWIRNTQTDIVWCNRLYAQELDVSPATVIAEQRELPLKPLDRRNIAGSRQPGRILAQESIDSKGAAQMLCHLTLGGRRRMVRVSESVLPGVNMTLGMAQDISREEELETEQKRYAAAHRELLEQLGTAIGIFSADQKLDFYNSAFAQLWGLEEQYLNGKPTLGDMMEKLRVIRRLPEQADFRKFKQGWLNMFTALIGPHEDMLYLPDGSALRMLAVPHPMGGLMMTFEDVTSRLELESSYNTLVAVQKETLDNLAEGISVFGGDGRLKLWNPSFARMWSLHPEDLQGQPHASVLAAKMKAMFRAEDAAQRQKALTAQGIDRTIRTGRMERADGSHVYYSTLPLPDGGVLVTHADVTDSARVENALREKNAALEAAERLKLDFLANVSYQLRTPLNAIIGFSEILSNRFFGELNAKQEEYTADIHEAGRRLLSLIDDILDLSTIEGGYMELERSDVAVRDVMEGIYKLTAEWARKESVEIRMICPNEPVTVHADERRLKQALLNLVRNAINFTQAGGIITLAARRTNQGVDLSVSDTGAGIPSADHERIFAPFERASGGSGGRMRGAGLGLALVRNIVNLHGGTIRLDSTPGQGTVFTISIPDAPARVLQKKAAKRK